MLFEHQGITLWYDTPDAPAPGENVRVGDEITIIVGIGPADINNKIEVIYRINRGATERLAAEWLRHDVSSQAQYFIARLPAFQAKDTVEYTVIGRCGGRQVPPPERATQFISRFTVNDSDNRLLATSIAEENLFAVDRSARNTTINATSPRLREVLTNSNSRAEEYSIAGTIVLPEGIDRAGIQVRALDRDLPSLERRNGITPQILGEAITDVQGYFQIAYTLDRFSQAEGISPFRSSKTKNADLSFLVFDRLGRELSIQRIVTQDREYGTDRIIFNAPTSIEVGIFIDTLPEIVTSEYEQLNATIAPVIGDLPLAELTESDVERNDNDLDFLTDELDLDRENKEHLKWLRRSALLAQQTALPIEAFYGWGRRGTLNNFAGQPTFSIADVPAVLAVLFAIDSAELRQVLQTAISDKIIPDLGDRLNEILAQIERLKVGQGVLVARRFIGKLLNKSNGEPLVGLTVRGFDLDAGQEPKDIGENVSNNEGVFALSYITPPPPAGADPAQIKRRLRLQILLNPQTQEKFETEVEAGGDQEILDISVTIPVPPELESPKLENLVPALAIPASPELLSFLATKNITNLAEIRKAGGISRLEGLPVAADDPSIKLLEAHADLNRISPNVELNAETIEKGFDSVTAIAQASRPDFVSAIRDRVGDFNAAQIQISARAQTAFLKNVTFEKTLNHMNGLEEDPLIAEKIRCRCRDCEAAVSPLAYLADLLKYATENIKNNTLPIKASDLAAIFHQPFDLPASCEAVDVQLRQVRLCVEVLRSYLRAKPPADATAAAKLAAAEKDYRLAAYTTLLTKVGTNYAELRLSRTNEPPLRQSLADRLGIDLSHLNGLLLNPNPDPANPQFDDLTEAALEKLFGLVDTTRDPSLPGATADLQTWRLEYLRTLWKQQDFPTDRTTLLGLSPEPIYQEAVKQLFQISQRLPIIDPDVVTPDDFRRPFLKTSPGDPDRAFDLWKKRRDWVDGRLNAFEGLPPTPKGIPDIARLLAEMSKPVPYSAIGGAVSVTAWASTSLATLETLRNQLDRGIDVAQVKFCLQDDYNLTAESFTRLMAIAAKAQAWDSDDRNEKVKDEEWREVYSILVQAQKVKLFAAWRTEESGAGIELDPQNFWIALSQPQEGEWPPIPSTKTPIPIIDPAAIKLKDLPDPIVGERAIAFWQARQTDLEQIPKDLATERQNNGFDAMLKLALGNPLPHDLDALKNELNNPATVDSATQKITDTLYLTVDSFKRLLVIKAKNDDTDLKKKPNATEWAELYAILTPARKINRYFPDWIAEEQNAATGVVYWNALKAKLPLWRATGETRQLWQQVLRDRGQPAIIDPDLIGPGDLKKSVAGDPAFDLWNARKGDIDTKLTQLAAVPTTLAGLDTNFQGILGISVTQFLAIATDQEKGNVISDRLAQLSLEVAEFNYLLRIAKLAKQNQTILTILDLEWENVYSILVQVWKRQQYNRWHKEEKAQNILLSSDFFQIPDLLPLQVPPKEPTVADIWRSPRIAYQDWQDKLQSRLDQENTTIQALAEAVGAAEEATLPMLRNALVLAINPAGLVVTDPPGELEIKAKWVTENLLIDAKMSGCSMTTRVAQAIETLQGLILALRTGQLEDLFRNFLLNLDNFDEQWKWLGSYASWRSAMFVFLYPENILQPRLRKPERQTPAFKALVENTGANRRLTPSDACEEAKEYSKYFQDICTIRIEASCNALTLIKKGEGCSKSDNGYTRLFYMFGRGGLTGKVYWSTATKYSQDLWHEVDATGFDNIISILGAVSYTINSKERYIFLFGKKQEGQEEKLVCAKYDLEKLEWLDEILTLELPEKAVQFTALVKQTNTEDEPPHLAFYLKTIRDKFGNPISRERKLNSVGSGWESEDFKPLYVLVSGKDVPHSQLVAMIAQGKKAFLIISEINFEDRSWVNINYYLQTPDWVHPPGPTQWRYDMEQLTSIFSGSYTGAFSLPNTEGIFLLTVPDLFSGYNFEQILGLENKLATEINLISPFPAVFARFKDTSNSLFSITLPVSGRLIPRSGISGNNFVFEIGDGSTKIIELIKTENPLKFTLESERLAHPFLSGPFDIPLRLSASELQIRRGLVEAAYKNNSSRDPYLEEAYYFVPVQLALALQRSGEYLAALDLLRTVYDYTTDVSKRKIYYGLVFENLLLLGNTYLRRQDWLLDPLNPHAIATTRSNTYTRFTLLTIIRCLLDYADAEFTQDTSESNPRARQLYLTALELLDSEELKQSYNDCDKIIGILDEPSGFNPPLFSSWFTPLQQIKSELQTIADPILLRPVVEQIRQALIADAPIEERFADARGIINEAISSLPSAPNITTVIQKNDNFNQAFERSLLSNSSLATALESVSITATEDFQQAVTSVTGISSVDLEQNTNDLPWLREPISLAIDSEETRPDANLAIARSGLTELDVLAPSYTATLAQVVALQPMNAVHLTMEVQEVHIPQLIIDFCIPPNPLLKTLRLRAELNLFKLRNCRNIAGFKRQLEPYAAPTDTTTGLPIIGAGGQLSLPGVVRLQPTLYRYQVLIERTKQLVQLAGQIEAAFLASLEKRDFEAYNLLKARQELNLAQASVQLQNLRIKEANDSVTLANLQKERAEVQLETYQRWIQDDLNVYEKQMIESYNLVASAQNEAAQASNNIQIKQSAISSAQLAAQVASIGGPAGVALGATVGAANFYVDSYLFNDLRNATIKANDAAAAAQVASANASFERRKQEWKLQELLATQDIAIGEQQVTLAKDRVEIVTQEKVIEELKASNAKDTIEFLTNKFTNVNLYDWMSGILEDVYRFFLQQATSMAKLAENQLAFERQEVPPTYIMANYWNAPADGATNSNTPAPDRKGLTGSARLLQDIYQLDQYAFDTNKRKLQLAKTLSLALLAPAEFQRFRETGIMVFATPMEMFDRDFPGHYLRLIRRVRTSVIALIPPLQGIHATLTSSGLSRTVIGPDIFQTVPIRRDPEFVALTSPSNSTGILELEPQQTEFLLPFEGNGVDSTWEFRMPKASNQFDYRTLADVLITIEYTALNSFDYRQQVIQTLNPNLSAERPFSFRNQFADQWYDLNNPEQTKTPMKVKFQTIREDFPPNLESLRIQQVLLYFVRTSEKTFELPITTLRFTEQGNQGTVGGSATPIEGAISTRRGNAGSWTAIIGKSPVGEWELTLPNTEEVKKRFQDEELDDILLVITYVGRTPEWPT